MPAQPATESGKEPTAQRLPHNSGSDALPCTDSATAPSATKPSAHDTVTEHTANSATAPSAHGNASAPQQEAPTVSDEDLMHGLCNGSHSALGELMRRWEIPLKSFLLRLGVPSADVEDTAQEAFVRLYLKRSAYRSEAPFKPWLLTLAANLGRNRMRWRLRRREQSIEPLFEPNTSAESRHNAHAEHADASAPAPSALAEQKQRKAAVRAIVATLPDKLRQAVVCVDLEGLSHAEAAQALGCTAKAVENRLHRARERIRDKCAHWLAEGKL